MELKDIQLPDSMKRAMARQAEAEREKRAKIIAAEGESLAAAALGEASDIMIAHPLALQLRNLQSLVEIGVDKNTTVVFPAPLMSTIQEVGPSSHARPSSPCGVNEGLDDDCLSGNLRRMSVGSLEAGLQRLLGQRCLGGWSRTVPGMWDAPSDAPITVLMTDVEGSTDLHTRPVMRRLVRYPRARSAHSRRGSWLTAATRSRRWATYFSPTSPRRVERSNAR